ncbi:hypothetical protein FQN49_001133 [Arthroderma sp. PD_2]|nr:hypothetical protein FQN49_001133 [Arthroderma sp. PD_2]
MVTLDSLAPEDVSQKDTSLSLRIRLLVEKKLLPRTISFLRRFRPSLAPRVFVLTPDLIVKYGSYSILSEARALEFVAKNTIVPLPRVVRTYRCLDGDCYILMKRCPGVPLSTVIHTMSEEEKKRILLQLRTYMDELRSLKPDRAGVVGSTDFGPLNDLRLVTGPCGPFGNVIAFHRGISGGFESPTGHDEFDKMSAEQDSRSYSINFTHGDLSLGHIYCHNGRITGIIDWESAGWFPDYWEYVMTWDSFWQTQRFRDDIASFLDPFPRELETEQTRRRLFGII